MTDVTVVVAVVDLVFGGRSVVCAIVRPADNTPRLDGLTSCSLPEDLFLLRETSMSLCIFLAVDLAPGNYWFNGVGL